MSIKRIIILILSLVITLSLCSCSLSDLNNVLSNNNVTLTTKIKENTTTKSSILTSKKNGTSINSSTAIETSTKKTTSKSTNKITTISSKTTIEDTTTTKKYIELTCTSSSNAITKYYKNFDINYYVNNLSSSEIYDEVYELISVASICVSYSNIGKYVYKTDLNPDTGKIQLFYSHIEFSIPSNNTVTWGSSGDAYNREHVWPQSLGDNKDEPGGHDLHQVRPTIASLNSARGNKLYGNCKGKSGSSSVNYKGTVYGYTTSSVFEPLDSVKGDCARICFYYAIKYGYSLSAIVSDKTYNELLEWNKLDPVSNVEINRNNEVEKIQGNRNIFIDYPELADFIWGK